MVISYNQRYPIWVWLEMVYMTPLMRKCWYSKSCVPIFWTPPHQKKMEKKSTCKVLALWLHYFRVEPPTRIYWDWGSFGFPISSLWVPQEFALHDRILVRSNFAMRTWAFQWTLLRGDVAYMLPLYPHIMNHLRPLFYAISHRFPRNSSLSPLTNPFIHSMVVPQALPWPSDASLVNFPPRSKSAGVKLLSCERLISWRNIVWQRSAGKTKLVV